jgi:hypothetical protein
LTRSCSCCSFVKYLFFISDLSQSIALSITNKDPVKQSQLKFKGIPLFQLSTLQGPF